MTDSTKQSSSTFKSMNPWVLHLQKLGLELKCPLCLELLKRPSLLPCDHIFCKSCLPETTQCRSECPLCKAHYFDHDPRPMSFVENIVTIYKSLDPLNSVQKTDQEGKFESRNGGDDDEQNGNTLPLNSQSGPARIENYGIQTDTHQVNQLSASSPRSTGDIKNPENEIFDRRSAKRNLDDSFTSGTDVNLRDSKRHKKLDYGPLNIRTTKSKNGNSGISNCQSGHTSVKNSESQTVCGFCQSSKISKETGSMLHFVDGKLVEGDEAYLSGAIHVHKICVDWAPQVYFTDYQTVKNLKSEVGRGAKLRCSGCDRKGAALGCYHKSCRRSYHVMCAKEIAGCRWDYDSYLVLCPAHTNVSFPNEKKSKSKNRVGNSQMPSQHSPLPDKIAHFLPESSVWAKEWVFCGSALSSEEKSLLVEFGTMIGVPVTKFWRPDVTHVIAATDSNGACTRTLKVLRAILHGKWVLKIDWVKACMNSIQPVAEEAYEISLDNHGSQNGPKSGRLSMLQLQAPKLFNGFDFYFSGDFVPDHKDDLENLVKAGGGNVLESKSEIVQKSHGQTRVLVVYNAEPPLGVEVTVLWQRLNDAHDLAAEIGCQVIGHTWLLESIASYKLQPF